LILVDIKINITIHKKKYIADTIIIHYSLIIISVNQDSLDTPSQPI